MQSKNKLKSILNFFTLSFCGFLAASIAPSFAYPRQETLISFNKNLKEVSLRQAPSNEQRPFPDGVYLYGRSSQPDQIGQEYLVFQVTENQVVGAFYQPASEFACFYGTINNQAMNLSVIDPHDQLVYPYSVALRQSHQIASISESLTDSVSLEGYKPLNTLSESDRHLLAVCLKAAAD
jgi:hypothetical protein